MTIPVDLADVAWLAAPFGDVDVIVDTYVERLAAAEDLVVERHAAAGPPPSMRGLLGEDVRRVHPLARRARPTTRAPALWVVRSRRR